MYCDSSFLDAVLKTGGGGLIPKQRKDNAFQCLIYWLPELINFSLFVFCIKKGGNKG